MRINQTTSGFGLIELMVSISIMLLVMTIIITRQDSFNGATLLRGEAYKIALLVRETQAIAVSAAYSDGSIDDYRSVLGVHFTSVPGGQNSYPVFKDVDNDKFYDVGEGYGRQGVLDNRFVIDDMRLMTGAAEYAQLTAVSVTFERPNFDAEISTSAGPVPDIVSSVEIDVRVRGVAGSGPGAVRTVEITRTGQISVKNVP